MDMAETNYSSAIGTERTFRDRDGKSAFGGKADIDQRLQINLDL
jgi:hypothetical protein